MRLKWTPRSMLKGRTNDWNSKFKNTERKCFKMDAKRDPESYPSLKKNRYENRPKKVFFFFTKKEPDSVFEPKKLSFCTIHLSILKKNVDFVQAWDTYLSSRRGEKQTFFVNSQMYQAKTLFLTHRLLPRPWRKPYVCLGAALGDPPIGNHAYVNVRTWGQPERT